MLMNDAFCLLGCWGERDETETEDGWPGGPPAVRLRLLMPGGGKRMALSED
jgi:hypothetical protein